ncbi:MAG: stage II sporulation protein M [Nanoarchaeota archaeon]
MTSKDMKFRKRKSNDLFRSSLFYIYAQRAYIYSIVAVFLFGSVLGFVYSGELGFLDKTLAEIFEKTKDLGFLEMVWFIFSNNIASAITSFVLGALLGIFPIFNAVFNGILLGYVYSKAVPIAGYFVIWRVLPHGIFELPAIFIALGLGVHLGASFFGKEKIKTLSKRFRLSFKAFLTVVLPLLVIAAIIESLLVVFAG